MKGVYKYDDLEVTDPAIEVLNYSIDIVGDTFKMVVFISDDNDGGVIDLPHPTDAGQPIPASTQQPALTAWAENYLQKFKK